MKLDIIVRKNGVLHCLGFLNCRKYSILKLSEEFIIELYCVHSHRYYFKAFFYNSERIFVSSYYGSLKKMYCAVQNMLKEEMYNVVQF